jgi:hypothetical protein
MERQNAEYPLFLAHPERLLTPPCLSQPTQSPEMYADSHNPYDEDEYIETATQPAEVHVDAEVDGMHMGPRIWICQLCHLAARNAEEYHAHLRNPAHAYAAIFEPRLVQVPSVVRYGRLIKSDVDHVPVSILPELEPYVHPAVMSVVRNLPNLREDALLDLWSCPLCDVLLTTFEQWQHHTNGWRHRHIASATLSPTDEDRDLVDALLGSPVPQDPQLQSVPVRHTSTGANQGSISTIESVGDDDDDEVSMSLTQLR